jgi:hypothetical protein
MPAQETLIDESARKELLLVAVLLVFLLAFGSIATAIFIKQWRREKRKR